LYVYLKFFFGLAVFTEHPTLHTLMA